MPNYRRWFVPGGTYFFTLVTFGRRPFLHEEAVRPLLRQAVENTRQRWPFEIVAWVLLPDHLHAVWTLPTGDDDYPLRWAKIKEEFTRGFLRRAGLRASAIVRDGGIGNAPSGSGDSGNIPSRTRRIWLPVSTTCIGTPSSTAA